MRGDYRDCSYLCIAGNSVIIDGHLSEEREDKKTC